MEVSDELARGKVSAMLRHLWNPTTAKAVADAATITAAATTNGIRRPESGATRPAETARDLLEQQVRDESKRTKV